MNKSHTKINIKSRSDFFAFFAPLREISFSFQIVRLLFLVPVLFFISCAENNPTTPDGKPDGKALYEQNCSICHGDDGKLGSAGAKDLSVSTMSMEESMSIILNGKGGMAPFGNDMLSEEQRKAVAEYIETLRK